MLNIEQPVILIIFPLSLHVSLGHGTEVSEQPRGPEEVVPKMENQAYMLDWFSNWRAHQHFWVC